MIVMLWILFLGAIAPISGSRLEYLRGVRRLDRGNYTDYYFSCNLAGSFLRWEFDFEPLRGFGIGDVGRVVVITRPTYEYTATLLSSQLDPESNLQRLDSVLVLSFVGEHPSAFEVTCSSNSEFTTENVTGMRGNAISTNSSNGMVVLEYIASSKIVHNKSKTHIFICGAQNDQLYYEIQLGLPIGFTEHDEIGEDRTVLSQDGNLVNTQGVLFARHPYRKTSLLFVTKDLDVTVTCYFGTNQAVFNSTTYVKSADQLPTSTHISPVTTTTSGSLVSSATTMLPSTTYETDEEVIVGSSNIVVATIISGVFAVIVIIIIIIIVMMTIPAIRKKKRVKYNICDMKLHTTKIDVENNNKEDQPNPPTLEDTPSKETSPVIMSSEEILIKSIPGDNVLKDLESLLSPTEDLLNTPEDNTSEDSVYGSSSISSDETSKKAASGQTISSESGSSLPLKREDPPMEAGLEEMVLGGRKSEQKHSDESASSSGYTSDRIQNPAEESGSGEAPLRICEGSTYLFGHESVGTELVKSFGSLQESHFIVAEGLKLDYFDYWSDNACPVYLPYIELADSYSLKNAFSSRSPDIVVCGESPDAVATGNTFKMFRVHSKDDNIDVTKKDVCVNDITEEGIYNTDDVRDNVTIESDDMYNNTYCGFFMEEYEDAQNDTRVTAENNVLGLLLVGSLNFNVVCSEEGITAAYKVGYFKEWFLPITMTEAELRICQSIREIFHVIQLVFRMVQTLYIMLYYQGLLWIYALMSEISEVPLDRGGTLHVPIVGTSSRWGWI